MSKALHETYDAARSIMETAQPETIEDLIRNGHSEQPWTAEDVRQLNELKEFAGITRSELIKSLDRTLEL